MKMQLRYISYLIALVMTVISCKKPGESMTNPPLPPPSQPPSGIFIGNKEYFYGLSWQKDSSGYGIKLNTGNLTDIAINRGVKVSVAIYTDWSPFYQLPSTFDISLTDTVNLTYTLVPGHLEVFAKTPVDIKWASDVSIEY